MQLIEKLKILLALTKAKLNKVKGNVSKNLPPTANIMLK